jgi:hypothetical protein
MTVLTFDLRENDIREKLKFPKIVYFFGLLASYTHMFLSRDYS